MAKHKSRVVGGHPALLAFTLGLVLSVPQDGAAQYPKTPATAGGVAEALRDGKASIKLRYRLENVSDVAFDKVANGSTLRTILTFQTLRWNGLHVYLEAENVSTIGDDSYNNLGAGSLRNDRPDLPVIADPAQTRLNQWTLGYAVGNTAATIGRREIILDDARFVGNVGWRQHHQTYEAFHVANTDLPRTTLTYTFVGKVHKITGASQATATHLINAGVDLGPVGQLSAFSYLLKYDEEQSAGLSRATFGGGLKGGRSVGPGTLLYEAKYAIQRDRANNPENVRADYANLMLGARYRGVTVKAGWEKLGGSTEDGRFLTPMATLHAFNGWADKFLATPQQGLQDRYAAVSGKHGRVSWMAKYHDFRADTGDDRHGSEVDLQFVFKAPWSQAFGAKAALYQADTHSTDTDKIWFWTGYAF